MQRTAVNRRQFLRKTTASGVGLALSGVGPAILGAELKPEEKIRVGVITEAGGAHLSSYLESLAQTPEAVSVALADSSGESVEDAKRLLGAKLDTVYEDAGKMLGGFKPAMALVSVEARSSPRAINAALDAGCHVMTEKPACVRVEDFEPLVRKAQKGGRFLMLALANRLLPAVGKAREIVRSGGIGAIYAVEAHLVADQTRLTRESYRKRWYCKKARAGGGHLTWLGIHWLDLISYISGLTVERVAGFAGVVGGQPIDVEDSAAMTLRFSNGTFATMTSGYYLDRRYHSHIKMWGSEGWIQLSVIEQKPLEWYSTKRTPELESFTFPERFAGYQPFVRACVRASAGLQEPPITGVECLRVLRTIFAFYHAAETGTTQAVT